MTPHHESEPPDTTTRVLYSGFRYGHHNAGSGYDAVVGDRRDYVRGDGMPFAGYPHTTRLRSVNFLLVDLVTLVRGLSYDTVHYFYPEDTAYLSPWLLRLLGKRIVYTVHNAERDDWLGPARSPFMRLKQLSLRGAHAIVVLSSSQLDTYSRAFPEKEVRFVPHGLVFDTAREPSAELLARRTTARRLVVVGTNYRDFDLLERIIARRGPREVEIHLVGMDDAVQRRFERQTRVVCHPRLDPASYDELLRESFALLLPLSFATANNALLEAYKWHLPAFASRIGGTIDYAVDGDRSLFSSPEEFWSKYDALAALEPPALRDVCVALHEAARARFSWPTIRGQLAPLYAHAPRGGA